VNAEALGGGPGGVQVRPHIGAEAALEFFGEPGQGPVQLVLEQVYGHVDVHDPVFAAALEQVWGTRP
jgi:hypothetical protein